MSEVAERFVSAWLYEGGFDVHEQMRRLTLDVVVRCLLGGASSERSEGFLSAFAAGTDTLTARTLLSRVVRSSPSPQTHTAVGRFDRAATRAAGVAAEAWLRTRPAAPSGLASGIAGLPDRLARAGLNSASETDDLLSSLLAHAGRAHAGQDGGGLTWEEGVSAELLTLLLAGHETTASALTWALAHLARMGPAAQSRVADPGDRSLERLVHEVLRLYPPAWVIPRLVVERFAAGGAVFEPGTNLVFSPYLLHRNPQVFPDPGRFAPERWDDGLLDLPPSGFLPFGVGGRACIGRRFAQEEMRVILRAVLGRVRLEGGGRVPKPSFHFTLRPASSVRLRVRPA